MSDHVWDAPVGATGQPDIDEGAGLYDEVEATEADEAAAAEGYGSWTVDELKDELRSRDLAVSGSKPELVARLEDDDA
jgi:hypothetical protein